MLRNCCKRFQFDKEKRELIKIVIEELEDSGTVGEKYNPHKLKGDYNDCMECHITPDLLLIWQVEENTINLIRLGSHSELFK